jgi:hypothetical protein
MPKAEFDKQGKLFWHLVKLSEWDSKRVDALLLKRWQATHWNALTTAQKSAAIAIMQRYANNNRGAHNKKLRSTIMALVSRIGYNKAWLYETFEIQEGQGLSKMDFPELNAIYNKLKELFPGKPGPKTRSK